MEGTKGSSGRFCRAAPTEKEATTATVALNRHIREKCQKFAQWQEQRTNVERQREYLTSCKQVRRATRADKERLGDEKLTELEDDMKHNRQRN